MKKIIKVISVSVMIWLIICAENTTLKIGYNSFSRVLGLFAGAFFPSLINSFLDLFDTREWKSSQTKLRRAGIIKKDTLIRISFAYLFRIKIDGKYFLVQNKRTTKYQPVGGAYKFNKLEADYLRKHFSIENDDCIPVDRLTELDYRLLVKNSDLRKFVRRFNKTNNRENVFDLSREFKEELFSTNILNEHEFGNLAYNYCGRHITEIKYGNVFKHFELLLADIVELDLNESQKEIFRQLMNKDTEKFVFATAEEISSCGVCVGTDNLKDNIADHSLKIMTSESDSLIDRNRYNKPFVVKL